MSSVTFPVVNSAMSRTATVLVAKFGTLAQARGVPRRAEEKGTPSCSIRSSQCYYYKARTHGFEKKGFGRFTHLETSDEAPPRRLHLLALALKPESPRTRRTAPHSSKTDPTRMVWLKGGLQPLAFTCIVYPSTNPRLCCAFVCKDDARCLPPYCHCCRYASYCSGRG